MDSIEKVAKEYEELHTRVEGIKKKMLPAMVKYLLINSGDLSKCTESGVAQGLRIPRSMARDLLGTLMGHGIVSLSDFEKIKPYQIQHIGPAVDLGLLEFGDYDEFSEVFSPRNLPAGEAPDISSGASYSTDGKKMRSFIRYGHERILNILYLRLNGFLMGYEPFQKASGAAKTPIRIAHLLFGDTGFPPELVADKVLDSVQLGVVERALLYTQQDVGGEDQIDIEEVRKAFAANLSRTLDEIYNATIDPLAKLIHEEGAREVLEDLGRTKPDGQYEHLTGKDERFDLSYLYAFSVMVESSARVAEYFGAEKEVLDKIHNKLTALLEEFSSA